MSQQGEHGNEGSSSGEMAGQPAVQPGLDQERVAAQTSDIPTEPLVTVTENIVPGQGRVITEFVARQVVHQYMRQPERGGRSGDRGNHGDGRNGGAHRGDNGGGGRNTDPPKSTRQSTDHGISGCDQSQSYSGPT